jgi:tetratricopeptide (TPR) repeat protein
MARQVRLLLSRVCLLGAAITLTLTGIFVFVLVQSGWRPFAPKPILPPVTFSQLLREYDNSYADGAAADTLYRLLDGLEKNALGVESHLSVLKRRRILVRRGEAPLAGYRAAAERAAAQFPYSELLAAVAAEGAVLAGEPEQAAAWAASLTEADLLPLSFAVAVLSGDFSTPEKALAQPGRGELLLLVSEFSVGNVPGVPIRDWELFTLDAAVLRVLAGDIQGASPLVQALTSNRPGTPATRGTAAQWAAANTALRFGAEYYYDFGNPRRAAELFARFDTDWALAREADALILDGDGGSAQNLWTVLSSPDEEGLVRTSRDILIRSLYNLAASAESRESELGLVQRLLQVEPNDLYGLIRYTRLLPAARAAAVLAGAAQMEREPLLGLEWLRRQRESWPVERVIPETWLLINRYPTAEPLYRWGIWYFDFQKQYAESARLQRNFTSRGGGAPWLDFAAGLALIRRGDHAGGEALLQTLEESGGAPWQVPANLGRLLEARRAPAAALEYYATAIVRAVRNADKAQLSYRSARCLRALGRDREARAALEAGLALDESNLAIRMELARYNDMGIF